MDAPENMSEKLDALRQLVAKRSSDREILGEKVVDLCSVRDGYFNHEDYVSPWTLTAPNLDADIMIVGQDWWPEKLLAEVIVQFILRWQGDSCRTAFKIITLRSSGAVGARPNTQLSGTPTNSPH